MFLSAQDLLRHAEKLERAQISSYDELIDALSNFLQAHRHELLALANYAETLFAKNPLAPAILFSYTVWGSTRRSDRSLDAYEPDDAARINLAGELAVGLRRRSNYTLFWEWLDMASDAAESASEGEDASLSADDLIQVVARKTLRELTTYFAELRDSLRHIDTLCQEFSRREHIYADERFLVALVNKIAAQPAVIETELWDLKEALDVWGCPREMREAAAVKFAEDIAAFANKRGGVLLIGIRDQSHQIIGVDDVENRIKHMEEMIRNRTDCSSDYFRVRAVQVSTPTAPVMCIVVVVGRTTVPVGVRQTNNSYTYPVRVGPGIERVAYKALLPSKDHMKGTTYEFAAELATWVFGTP